MCLDHGLVDHQLDTPCASTPTPTALARYVVASLGLNVKQLELSAGTGSASAAFGDVSG